MTDRTQWVQGNWNTFVVLDCPTRAESRKRYEKVPDRFKPVAGNHAGTYWDLQEKKDAPKKTGGFAGMSEPYQDWTLAEITPEYWAAGKEHLEKSHQDRLKKFGDQVLGFAAEYPVAEWFAHCGVEHHKRNNPTYTGPDFTIHGLTVDLKSVSTKGLPRPDYDANLAEAQRLKSSVDWYLFGKYDNTTAGDFYILGFQTEQVILDKGAFYRKGEITRKKMKAPVDCWCIEYKKLIKPMDWLAQNVKSPLDSGESGGLI